MALATYSGKLTLNTPVAASKLRRETGVTITGRGAALARTLDVDAQVLLVVGRRRVAVVHALGRVVVPELHEQVVARAHRAEDLVEAALRDEVLRAAAADRVVGDLVPVGEVPSDHLTQPACGAKPGS